MKQDNRLRPPEITAGSIPLPASRAGSTPAATLTELALVIQQDLRRARKIAQGTVPGSRVAENGTWSGIATADLVDLLITAPEPGFAGLMDPGQPLERARYYRFGQMYRIVLHAGRDFWLVPVSRERITRELLASEVEG